MGVTYTVGDMCFVQLNKLDCDGTPLTGTGNSLVTCCVTGFEMEPITEDTDDREGVCTTIPGSSEIKGFEVEWTISEQTDVDLLTMLGMFQPVLDAAGQIVGVEPICGSGKSGPCVQHCGDQPCADQGVSMAIWSQALCGDSVHPDFPWVVDIIPRIKFNAESIPIIRHRNQDLEESAWVLSGRTYVNNSYGQGPGGLYPNPDGLQTCITNLLTDLAPEMCPCEVCNFDLSGFESGSVAVGG